MGNCSYVMIKVLKGCVLIYCTITSHNWSILCYGSMTRLLRRNIIPGVITFHDKTIMVFSYDANDKNEILVLLKC